MAALAETAIRFAGHGATLKSYGFFKIVKSLGKHAFLRHEHQLAEKNRGRQSDAPSGASERPCKTIGKPNVSAQAGLHAWDLMLMPQAT